MSEIIRMPIICPTCKGAGSLPLLFYSYGTSSTLEAAICPRCLGTGKIGFVERTQTEIYRARSEDKEEDK